MRRATYSPNTGARVASLKKERQTGTVTIGRLVVFTGNFDAGVALLVNRDGKFDGPAAHLAIFDIGLLPDRAVDFHMDGFPAVGAADTGGTEASHVPQ